MAKVKETYKYAADTSGYVLALKDSHMDTAAKEKMTKVGHIIQLIVTYAFLVVMGIVIIFPFYWMIITSLKTGFSDVFILGSTVITCVSIGR